MAKIIIKKSTVPAKVPVVGDLDIGELAVNTADAKLYTKHNDNTIKELGVPTPIESQTITATAGQTVFNFTAPVARRLVFANGYHQASGVDYTVTGVNQITFTVGRMQYDIVTAEAKN